MARAIDADVFIRDLTAMKKVYDAISLDGMIKALEEAPTIDPVKDGYVSFGAYEQVRWERDVAIDQLNSYGVRLGEKAELQRVKHGKWGEMYFHEGEQGYVRDCSVCQMPQGIGLPDYCPNCGARIDGE